MTTAESKIFKDEFLTDKWYFWDDSWASTCGPYADYTEAHMAMSAHIQAAQERRDRDGIEGQACL